MDTRPQDERISEYNNSKLIGKNCVFSLKTRAWIQFEINKLIKFNFSLKKL